MPACTPMHACFLAVVRRVSRALMASGLICICHSCRAWCLQGLPGCWAQSQRLYYLCDGLCVNQQGQERPPGQTREMLWSDRHLDLLVTLLLSSPASPLGMPHGAATFMGTCSEDKMDCVSEVSVPEILEGETVCRIGWGGWGGIGSPGPNILITRRGRGAR